MQYHVAAALNHLIVAGTARRGGQPDRRGIEVAADGGRTAGQIEKDIIMRQIQIGAAFDANHDAAAGQRLAVAAQNNLVIGAAAGTAAQIEICTVSGTARSVSETT